MRLDGRNMGAEDARSSAPNQQLAALTARMRLGTLPSSAMTRSRATASSLPTTSEITDGRYFSTWWVGLLSEAGGEAAG